MEYQIIVKVLLISSYIFHQRHTALVPLCLCLNHFKLKPISKTQTLATYHPYDPSFSNDPLTSPLP